MAEPLLTIRVDGEPHRAAPGTVLAALLLQLGRAPRRSVVAAEPRAALCGMGVCFECRATVDGVPHVRTCMVECREGMQVETEGRHDA